MISFKEELKKYNPILELDDIESSIHSDELLDMYDLLKNVLEKNSNTGVLDRQLTINDEMKDKE